MIIQILIEGDSSCLNDFHKKVSIFSSKIKTQGNQILYTCMDSQFETMKMAAIKSNVNLYKWNDKDKQWIIDVKKTTIKPNQSRR